MIFSRYDLVSFGESFKPEEVKLRRGNDVII